MDDRIRHLVNEAECHRDFAWHQKIILNFLPLRGTNYIVSEKLFLSAYISGLITFSKRYHNNLLVPLKGTAVIRVTFIWESPEWILTLFGQNHATIQHVTK